MQTVQARSLQTGARSLITLATDGQIFKVECLKMEGPFTPRRAIALILAGKMPGSITEGWEKAVGHNVLQEAKQCTRDEVVNKQWCVFYAILTVLIVLFWVWFFYKLELLRALTDFPNHIEITLPAAFLAAIAFGSVMISGEVAWRCFKYEVLVYRSFYREDRQFGYELVRLLDILGKKLIDMPGMTSLGLESLATGVLVARAKAVDQAETAYVARFGHIDHQGLRHDVDWVRAKNAFDDAYGLFELFGAADESGHGRYYQLARRELSQVA